jgi:hypothetical protein
MCLPGSGPGCPPAAEPTRARKLGTAATWWALQTQPASGECSIEQWGLRGIQLRSGDNYERISFVSVPLEERGPTDVAPLRSQAPIRPPGEREKGGAAMNVSVAQLAALQRQQVREGMDSARGAPRAAPAAGRRSRAPLQRARAAAFSAAQQSPYDAALRAPARRHHQKQTRQLKGGVCQPAAVSVGARPRIFGGPTLNPQPPWPAGPHTQHVHYGSCGPREDDAVGPPHRIQRPHPPQNGGGRS